MSDRPTRRAALRMLGSMPLIAAADASPNLDESAPPGVRGIIRNTLREGPASLNTDWFGTTLMQGLLEWYRRGVREVRPFADAWLDSHLRSGKISSYSGARSRPVVAGGIHITTYAGHFGLAFPCYEMAVQFGDERARRACVDVGAIILHQASRNRFGMVEHDDSGEFAIPDTCYFVVRSLMSASALDRELGPAFRDQAKFQLRTYVDHFLVRETGLARTVLFRQGPGRSFWTRASGWLLWAINSVLRQLSPQDLAFAGFRNDLNVLASGMGKRQHPSGGFHVLLDDPQTPLETTGTAMFASAVHEAVRRKWLPASHAGAGERAWEFVKRNLLDDGSIRNAYTGWAIPAEQHEMSMDEHRMGWIPGFVLIVANELTLSSRS